FMPEDLRGGTKPCWIFLISVPQMPQAEPESGPRHRKLLGRRPVPPRRARRHGTLPRASASVPEPPKMVLRVGRLWGSCARNLFGDFRMKFRKAVRQMGHIAIQKKGERRGCAAALTAEAHERRPRQWVPRDFLEQMKYPQFASRAHEPGEIQRQILARGVADGANGYGANVPSPSLFQHFEALHFDGVGEHAQTSLFPGRQDEMIRGTKLLHSSCAALARPLQQ